MKNLTETLNEKQAEYYYYFVICDLATFGQLKPIFKSHYWKLDEALFNVLNILEKDKKSQYKEIKENEITRIITKDMPKLLIENRNNEVMFIMRFNDTDVYPEIINLAY